MLFVSRNPSRHSTFPHVGFLFPSESRFIRRILLLGVCMKGIVNFWVLNYPYRLRSMVIGMLTRPSTDVSSYSSCVFSEAAWVSNAFLQFYPSNIAINNRKVKARSLPSTGHSNFHGMYENIATSQYPHRFYWVLAGFSCHVQFPILSRVSLAFNVIGLHLMTGILIQWT